MDDAVGLAMRGQEAAGAADGSVRPEHADRADLQSGERASHVPGGSQAALEANCQRYGVSAWGAGYFVIDEAGRVVVCPDGEASATQGVAIRRVVEQLRAQGVQTPVLLRFGGVLEDRMHRLAETFKAAADEHGYDGGYRCVYPVKVNQQRHVVEEVLRYGRPMGFGLEAGSKPELLAVLAMVEDERTPIVCNGFKDRSYLEAVVLATKLGRDITPVVERFGELRELVELSVAHGVWPTLGVRMKLGSMGSGQWEASGGERSKFGLTYSELLDAVRLLEREGMLGCLRMVHAHVGSQVSDIRSVKSAVTELARVYVELRRLGAGLDTIDVGGGLAVDYVGGGGSGDGGLKPAAKQTSIDSVGVTSGGGGGWGWGMNYGLREYANDVVYHTQAVCDDAGEPYPLIVSESGRAITAHHSVLVMSVVGWTGDGRNASVRELDEAELSKMPQPLRLMHETVHGLERGNVLEGFHDLESAKEAVDQLFALGHCTLEQRALGQRLHRTGCEGVWRLVKDRTDLSPELRSLETRLCETYFCNASVFQSLPDAWAIGQVFPVMPLHRLDEEPTCRGVLADITCDSDGKLDRFRDPSAPWRTRQVLDLHAYDGRPYDLGVFLVGAYQETLGDLHNLFGDTNAVHVTVADDGSYTVDEVVEGDTAAEVLGYVQFNPDVLRGSFHAAVRRAEANGRLTGEESRALQRFYDEGLAGYTYLT
ncbi:MAG: biosynthetic arginine decarboxylase [Planctomycetota bacterium]